MIPFCYVCIKPLDLRRICRCLKAGSCHLLDFVSMPQVENSLNNIQKQKPATYENSLSLPPSIFYQMSFMDAQTEFGQCVRAQEKYIFQLHAWITDKNKLPGDLFLSQRISIIFLQICSETRNLTIKYYLFSEKILINL